MSQNPDHRAAITHFPQRVLNVIAYFSSFLTRLSQKTEHTANQIPIIESVFYNNLRAPV